MDVWIYTYTLKRNPPPYPQNLLRTFTGYLERPGSQLMMLLNTQLRLIELDDKGKSGGGNNNFEDNLKSHETAASVIKF